MSTHIYRAWHKEQKKMYRPKNDENSMCILEFYEEEGQIAYPSLHIQIESWAIIKYTKEDIEEGTKLVSSSSGVLMQSIGLSDKNGKEIFCGDGIRVYIENTALDGVVEDDEENARFIINVNGNEIGFQNVNHFSSKTEIIGDIYTTPELLTKQ